MLLLPTYYYYYTNKPITFLTIRPLDWWYIHITAFENETKFTFLRFFTFTFLNNLQDY